MKLTKKTIQALRILDVEYGRELSAGQFASLMWPNSPAWRKVSNTGNGATSGKGMWLSAGSYLAKLKKRGLVVSTIHGSTQVWRISSEGRKALTVPFVDLTKGEVGRIDLLVDGKSISDKVKSVKIEGKESMN